MIGENLPKTSITELYEAGVHFGHKEEKWNPKMEPYIYGARDKVHIIDLKQTLGLLDMALKVIYDTVKKKGKVLIVGTKVQAADIVKKYAEQCGQYYINDRWLGGTLTNWKTISQSIKTLDETEALLEDEDRMHGLTKREIGQITKRKQQLIRSLGGIRKLGGRPDLVVILDTNKEHLAILEAHKLRIPIIGIVDTNSDPQMITYPIPGNDDAIRSIELYCRMFAEAALNGVRDSLTESGIDIGESTDANAHKNRNTRKVTRYKPSQKFSRPVPTSKDEAVAPAKVSEGA